MAGHYSLEVRGDKTLAKLLHDSPLDDADQRRIVGEGIAVVLPKARSRAPGRAASLISAVYLTVAEKLTGKVIVQHRDRKGFRYLWALDGSKKTGRGRGSYHYRGGANKGGLTRGWFTGSAAGVMAGMQDALKRQFSDFAAKWRGA